MANINAQFNYSANFGPVIGQMQKLTAEANLLNNTLQNLDKQSVGLKQNIAGAFASDLGKIGGWNAKMVELTDSVDQFGQSLLKQKLTLKQYAQEAIGAFTKSSNAHKLAVREVSREMSQLVTLGKGMDGKQMGMMITPATINLKDFNTQLAVSQKQWSIFNSLVQDGTTHLINFGKNTQWAGRQITVGLTVPLTIYGNAVSKIFREVDAELTRFQKVYGSDLMNSTSDATDQMVNDVRNLAIEFSKSFGIAAKETASLAADLAATGLEGQKLLASLRETTRLAVLGDVSNQDAMKTTLSLQNAFKISTDDLAESVNFLNAVENQTSLSLQDLTTAIPKAGPVIKALGGDVKDLSLLMVALKEGGISAAEGANALKSGMASLINPTKQASATAKQYGIDINAIVQANRGQLMPTIMAFQQQLELLDDFGKAQVIENVFGKYQFARLSALFDNLNASASQTNAVLGLMGKSSKELAATAYQEMDTLMNSSSKRFQRAIEGIKAQFISIGQSITESITPILENVTGKIAKAIEFFQNLPKPVKSFIKVATGLTAIAGPIIMMVGIFSNFLGYIGKGAMGMVNLGRRMAGIPVQKFEMLTDTQIMAQKATAELARSFDVERSSVERLNQALGIYRQNLVDAINLNPAFVNRQMPSITPTTPTAQLQKGGSAWVPGSGDGDKVPAMLEPGEYVVNKKAAAKYSGTLDQINFQSAPRFQKGGRMPGYADTSMLPYESIREVRKAEPFIGPLPQISYGVQGTYRPGGYTPFMEYPFSSKEKAEAFQASDPRKYGGRTSRITRDINDPQQQAYADWIAGHNSNQFRTGTGIMKRLDMEGHRDQMLRSMGPISQSIPLFRGTVLKEKGANEFSGVGARELLMYIKYGMFEKAMGKKIQWSDMQSFSSIPNIANYSKFIESWTNPSNTNSKKAADRQLANMEMLPVIFRLASAKGQNGFNLSERALVQEVGMGDVVDEKEWVLNKPSGTISGIRQDMGTKNYIIDLMQKGGRVQSHAEESKDLSEAFETYKIGYSGYEPEGHDYFELIRDYGKGAGASVTLRPSDVVKNGWLIDKAFSSGAPQTAIVELMVQARKMVQEQGGDLSIRAIKNEGSYSTFSAPMLLAAERMGLISFSEEEKLQLSDANEYTMQDFLDGKDPEEGVQRNISTKQTAEAAITASLKFVKGFKPNKRGQDETVEKIDPLPNWKKEFLKQKSIPLKKQMGGRIQSHQDESFRAPFQKTDKEYETVYKWISGELDYFRQRKNVKGRWTDSEKFDAERYQQLLGVMRSVPEGTRMMRGSVLNPGMSGEMSKETQLAMLTAIQTGDYGSLYGMEVSFSDFASFASNFMGEQYGPRGVKGVSEFSQVAYNKLYRGVHSRDTESGRFFDDIERQRATGKESKYGASPVMYDFTAGPNTQGRDISMGDPSTGAPYPKYNEGWVSDVPDGINEILTYGAQGSITGVSSDIQSRQPIIHMQGKQMGGRIKGYADKSKVLGEWTSGGMKGVRSNLYKYQELTKQSAPVPAGTRLGRGTVLNPGLSKELSAEQQIMLLSAIQSGDYSSIIGKELNFRGLSSFSENPIGEQYSVQNSYPISRFMENALAPYSAVGKSGSLEKAISSGLKVGPAGYSGAFFDFIAGKNTKGINTGVMGIDAMQETILSSASGRITGVSSDTQTKKPIFHIQGYQSGGRINGYADKSLSKKDLAFQTALEAGVPINYLNNAVLRFPTSINQAWRNSGVVPGKDIIGALKNKKLNPLMLFKHYLGKNINPSFENQVVSKVNPKNNYSEDAFAKIFRQQLFASHPKDEQRKIIDQIYAASAWRIDKKDLIGTEFEENIKGRKLIVDGVEIPIRGTRTLPAQYGSLEPFENLRKKKDFGFAAPGVQATHVNQSGSVKPFRLKSHATETTSWDKKAAAPKAYAGVLQGIPNWATKPAEYEAIVTALRAAGIPEADTLAGHYIRDVLAHINPSTTNANGIYEKVWSAANLMKDSQVYNVFLETLRTRKDIGGLLNPSTVSRVAAASGLPMPLVQAELTKIADGVHPNTANGAKVMMTLARMFPSRTSPGMPIAVAAGMGARLQGNFYDTLGQRALPSNLPNTTVRAYDPKGTGAPTSSTQGSRTASSGIVMPSGAIRPGMVMPNIQSISSAAGGTGTSATVKVDGMGNVLSNGIDDMVANTITGQPIAVSSKELLAIGPGGGIAGVTSPGDEARGKIVHPMGTALMRGKNFQQKRLKGFAGTSGVSSGLDIVEDQVPATKEQVIEPVFDQPVARGGMDKFTGRMMMMVGAVDQMRFAMNQFTSETSNGTSKWVASMNLALTATQMIGQGGGSSLIAKGKQKQGLEMKIDPQTNQPLMDEKGNPIYGKAAGVNPSKMSSGLGKAMAGLGKAANFLGNPAMQIGLQVGIMAVNKGIEMYQKTMENAKKAGNAAFGEPTESAKLLGIELKSLTAGSEKLGKSAEKIFGVQGKGSYDKAFEKVVKTDYQDLITIIGKAKTEQEQLNQLTNVYSNLIQRGFDPKNAKELTAEIARQAEAMGAFTKVSGSLDNIKDSKDAVKAQLETFQSQMTILEDRRDLATSVGGKDLVSGALGVASMVPGMNILSRGASAALGSGPLKTQSSDLRADAVNEFFGVQGDEFWKKALRGTGLDRNPLAQVLGGYLADKTIKTQMAAQLGATIKSVFSIAADNPTASNEALRMLVAQFDSVDWDKAKEELSKIAEEKGFGDLSQIGQFVQSDTFKNLGEREQTIALSVINAGAGPQFEKMLTESWESIDWDKLGGIAAQNLALNAIDMEVDIQLKDSMAQMELLKTAIQQSFTVAIEAKQKELEIEDKRHEKAIKNLDDEAKRIADKKDILQRNTDYYIKELEREKQAEDYYANQRKTGLSGLKAISGGDVFGFIGAQMDAASSADQFGRDRSIQAIQETADAGQKKLDEDLRNIDNRKEAEAARHEQEIANINAEIEFLQKKQSATVGGIDKATKLLEKAMAMSPGDKGYQQAVTDAVQAAEAAGGSGQQVMQELNISSPDKDIQGRIDSASKSLGDALKIITGDTTDAVDRLNAASEIAKNVFESLDLDPSTSQAYTDLFKTLQTPIDPTVSEAIQAFKYGTVDNKDQNTLDGPPVSEQGGSKTKVYKKNTVAVRGKTPYSPVTKATGGMIEGPGTGTSDSILAMVSNGEYVVRAEAVKNIGKAKLDQLNRAGLNGFAMGGLVGSMPAMSSAPGFASGGSVPMPTIAAPSTPKYNVPSAGGGMSPSPIAQMARGGQVNSSSSNVNSSPVMNFNGAGMDMVMHHVNKAVGGRISSNSRRIG